MKKQLAVTLALAISGAALAQDPRGRPNEPGYSAPGFGNRTSAGPMERGQSFRGEVRGFDSVSGTISLKHDSIEALMVPARTTEYAVKDKSLLDNIKVGDRVRFSAVIQGRSLLVTNIVPAD